MYRIGEFSKMARTTIKTLRHYDETGLLKPAFVDEANGYRYYTTDQLLSLHSIVSLRQIGLSVEDIRHILSGQNAESILQTRKAELETEFAAMQSQLSRIQWMLTHNKEDVFMNYQATIKELPACTVFYKQGVVPNFADYRDFILQAGAECKAANPNLKCLEPDYCYTSYLDPEFREQNISLEYAQAVEQAGVETDTIRFKQIDRVDAVCVYVKGPYDHLRDAYTFAYRWIEENGYAPIQSSRDHYIDGMWNKENPEDWLTEIQIPVRKK